MSLNRLPGVASDRSASYRQILRSQDGVMLLPGGVIVDGSKSRDPLNTGDLDVLRNGMLLGKITASGKYAPSILGVSTVAYADNDLTITVSTATAIELVRRIGTSGDLHFTGPPSAGGTVAVTDVAYTAVDTGTGEITVPDLNLNKVVGSFIQPADGSETILGIMGIEDGLKVTDQDAANIDVRLDQLIIAGQIDASQLINYPADAALKAWVKAALRAVGGAYVFDDDF